MVLAHVGNDIREALRRLKAAPGFTIVTLASFALGIGATTAIFSVLNQLVLQPLSFQDPSRLVMLWESNAERGWNQVHVAPANALDWRERVRAFADVALVSEFTDDVALSVESGATAEQVRVSDVGGNAFAVLGARFQHGRGFTEADTWAEAAPAVVLSHRTWVSRFGGDPRLIGRSIQLDGVAHQVIGVLAPGFRYTISDAEVFTTFRWAAARRASVWFRQAHVVRAIARLAPGVTAEQAAQELAAAAAALEREYPATNTGMRAGLTPLHRFLIGDRDRPLHLLLAAAVFLQLIVCANVANLLTARSFARRRDVALRKALGAASWRIARLSLTEALVLAALGSLLGVLVGAYAIDAMAALRPAAMPDFTFQLDWRVLTFTAVVALLSAVLAALRPALADARLDLRGVLADASRSATGGPRSFLASHALMAVEVALAVMLVAGSGLMLRSLGELGRLDSGANLDGVVTFEMRAPSGTYPNDAARAVHTYRMLDALRAVPGVFAAGAGRSIPLGGRGWTSDFTVEGWDPGRFGTDVRHREVTAGYFRALEIPVVAGDLFRDALAEGEAVPVVVNEAFARRYGTEGIVGRRIAFDRAPDSTSYWYTIVGVVGNERMDPMTEPEPEIIAHIAGDTPGRMRFLVRSDLPFAELSQRLRAAAAAVDPGVPLANLRTLRRAAADALAAPRYLMVLLTAFAAIAITLALVGVYGVAAEVARSRVREVGIRVALGASTGHVIGTLASRSLTFVALGIGVGVLASLAAGSVLAAFLFGVQPSDPATLVRVTGLVLVVAMVAALVPAWRSSKANAVEILNTAT